MKKFYMALPFTIAIITNKDGNFLVGRHPDLERKPYPGLWDMPGGKVEENETFEDALKREVKEETGFEVTSATLVAVFHHFRSSFKPCASPLTVPGIGICYKIEVTGDFKPTELEDMHWASVEELAELELTPWCDYLLRIRPWEI